MRAAAGRLAVVWILAIAATSASAASVTLSNGLAGSAQYSVAINENGYSTQAWIQAPGYGVENLMYEYIPILDVGGTAFALSGGTWIDGDPSDGSVTSMGTTGSISWSVTHSLAAGGTVMTSRYSFGSAAAAANLLPSFRFFQYLDEDVYSISNNILIVNGSIAGGDLDLLTVEPTIRAGVSQGGDAQATGWAADQFAHLRSALYAGGYDAASGGSIDLVDLVPHVDPYFGPAYGPEDITTAIEWEFLGGQRFVTFEAYLGGVPEAPPGVPEPGTLALVGLGLMGLGVAARKRLRR